MSYFDHAFRLSFLGTHATQAETFVPPGAPGATLVHAGISNGFLTSEYTTNGGGGGRRLQTSDLQSYAMGPGTFGFFDKDTNQVVVATDFPIRGCCPLVLASASVLTHDKIGPFHGGYLESTKSKWINPKYISQLYRVDPCTPQQAVVSIGTTPYTNGGSLTGALNITNAGTNYTNNTYLNVPLQTTTGNGVGALATVVVGGTVVTSITITTPGAGYSIGDLLTISNTDLVHSAPGVDVVVTLVPNDVNLLVDATCCTSFLCGETYNLRIDVKGSPALRALNHNAYQTIEAYTGCCPGPVPTVVDPTLVYLTWANAIVVNNYLKDFVAPVVFDYTGVAWYAPGTTVTLDGSATPVVPAQWWGTANGLVDNYTASVQAAAWAAAYVANPVAGCAAGMRLYGAFVETTFGNCSFQVTDFFEKEPVRIYASLVDYTGDPCIFTGLCVYHECDGVQGMGFGEQVVRDLILSESYLQNFFHSDIRIREITQGSDILNSVNRNALYTRYFIQHNVPRHNNPTGMFDNDQYLLEIVTPATSTALETFLTAWLGACGDDCISLDVHGCNHCVIPLDTPLP